MKTLSEYIILEKINKDLIDIKFDIWAEPKHKVTWIKNNEAYQKIEYKYIDKKKSIEIDFLLGFTGKSWKLWVGKIGGVSYDDDYYKDLETESFDDAILNGVEIIREFIKEVKTDKENWIQFYVN